MCEKAQVTPYTTVDREFGLHSLRETERGTWTYSTPFLTKQFCFSGFHSMEVESSGSVGFPNYYYDVQSHERTDRILIKAAKSYPFKTKVSQNYCFTKIKSSTSV